MYTWKAKSRKRVGARLAHTTTRSQHSESHISKKRSMVGGVGLDPSCGLLLELLFVSPRKMEEELAC